MAVDLSRDCRTLISGGTDSMVRMWDLTNGAVMAFFVADAPIRAVKLFNDTVIAGDQGGQLHFLRLRLPAGTA
jgi:hypothetical protein